MDAANIIAVVFLIVQLVWNIYLMRQNHVLINKLMSRNYSEYKMAEAIGQPEAIQEEEPVEDPYFNQRAQDLNGIMGMG